MGKKNVLVFSAFIHVVVKNCAISSPPLQNFNILYSSVDSYRPSGTGQFTQCT